MLLPSKNSVFSAKNDQVSNRRKSCGRPNIFCWTFTLRTSVADVICAGKGIILALSVTIFMFSCTSGSNQIIKEQVKTEPAKPEKVEPEESVKRTIALLIKKTTLYGDGEIDVYAIYNYSENSDQLMARELYSSQDELIERVSFSYENNLLTRKAVFNAGGEQKSYRLYTYNNLGLLESDTLYDKNEKIQTISKYEYYTTGERKKWSIYNGSEALLGYSIYTYKNEKLIRTDIFSPQGNLELYSTVEYNQNLQKIEVKFLAPSGELEKYSQYNYENDLLILESYFNSENKLQRQVKYGYDNQGSIIRIEHIDGNGQLKETIEQEYLYKEQES